MAQQINEEDNKKREELKRLIDEKNNELNSLKQELDIINAKMNSQSKKVQKEELIKKFEKKYIEPLRHIEGKCFIDSFEQDHADGEVFYQIGGIDTFISKQKEVNLIQVKGIKNLNLIEDDFKEISKKIRYYKGVTTNDMLDNICQSFNINLAFDVRYVAYNEIRLMDGSARKRMWVDNIYETTFYIFHNHLKQISEKEFNKQYNDILEQIEGK